jgi:hypothetical protein
MEVILKEDVANLGHRGDVVKVADGYGRNFLLPRKLALQATQANKAVIEQMKAAAARRSATEKAQAEDLLVKLQPTVLSFTRKSGENGHLFRFCYFGRYRSRTGIQGLRYRPSQDSVVGAIEGYWRLHDCNQAAP